MPAKETILVTGSSGFIGGWIVEMLHFSRSANFRAGIRSWSSAARLSRFPIEIVLCDVMDQKSIAAAMDQVSCVIHCVSGPKDVIIQGTANILEASHRQKVRRFVHVSTAEVYGNVCGEIDETFPFISTGNEYADAKIEAEKLCWEQYNKKNLPVTVVRPSIVYGPFSRDWTVGFAQKLSSGNWGIFNGLGSGTCNLVYVTDLVSGILQAANNDRAVGEAFNLNGPDFVTWNEYFQKFNIALGLPELRYLNPAYTWTRSAVTDPIRSFGKLVLKYFKTPLRKISQGNKPARDVLQYADKSLKTIPRLSELALYSRKAIYVTDKARDVLGFQAHFDINRGIDLSVQWLGHMGLLDNRR